MDDLLTEFLTETSESLAVIDLELVKFEQNPNDSEILGNIFRLVHTIKGTCGFLGLPRLEAVAHAGENVLGKFRDGDLEVSPDAVTLILKCIDAIRELLHELEQSGSELEGDDGELIAELNAMAEGRAAAKKPAEEPEPESEESGPVIADGGFPVAAELLAEVEEAKASGVEAASFEQIKAELEAQRAKEAQEAAPPPPPPPEPNAPEPEEAEAPPPVPAEPRPVPAVMEEEPREPKESAIAAQSIRVNVDLLENLMTLVSELVLTRNQLLQMVRGQDDNEFSVPLQRLSHITTDLQEGVMKTRMQPIGNAWAKLPRIVRDLSVESGKKIDLQMLGAETELDRQVLEMIKDPLTHMVRNSADHGLETASERAAFGKPETGSIILNAFHEGGHIIIEITDDGRGLDVDKIRDKAVRNGLASEAEAGALSDQQIMQFIFKAGLSTAEKVTSVSGRGVGMDVVRTNIEKIGGAVELKSQKGQGSTFTIKIPLTLAIVSALIVECSGERFAIPQISVLELVRASNRSETTIEMINEAPVLRLRDRLLPLVSLRALLELDEGEDAVEEHNEVFIVVTQVGTYNFGVIVDRVFDTEEIVVKPVAPILRHIPFYSGNTILGDGSVIMILDPNGVATAAGQVATHETETSVQASEQDADKTALLVFRAGGDELKAVPLALVARLEEIDMRHTERSQGDIVVQYRGRLMPLVPFNPDHDWDMEASAPILVFTERNRSMGLVVDEIVDIVEDRLNIELSIEQNGLIGSAVIDGKATDVIDAGYYLIQAYPDWFGNAPQDAQGARGGRRILLVDDSPFFRNLMTPVLSVAGFDVTTAESAEQALTLRDDGAAFDAIVSDIDMPDVDGFEFARKVRSDERWADVPMVAISSHASSADFELGREVGYNDYVAKYDRDALVHILAKTVAAPR